jgi:hypothetical protein
MMDLQSVKVVGKFGYLNSDPELPFVLPSSEFGVNGLAQHIQRAAVDYYLTTTWENCRTLALKIAKQIIGDTFKGGLSNAD